MTSNTEDENEFVVIGAGLPRTGTFTLKSVLPELLGKPCYHTSEVVKTTHHTEFWASAMKGKRPSKEEWKKLLKGYGGGVDAPVCLFYKELMEVYPNAKVILTVRDPELWHANVIETTAKIAKLYNTKRGRLFMTIMGRRKFPEFLNDIHKAFCGDNWEEGIKEDYIYHYRKHVEEVKRVVPKDKLLIFDIKEGYAPLCKFLNVPVREGSLPPMNDKALYNKFIGFYNLMTWGLVMGTLGVGAACAWCMSSFFG